MIVYIDAIWLLNFIVDGLLLLLTAYLLKRKWKWFRIFLGALLGSSLVFFAIYGIFIQPIYKIILSIGIIITTFGFVQLKLFVKTLFFFYLSTFAVGGGIIGLHYLLQSNISYVNGISTTVSNGYGDPISWGFVIIMIPIMIYLSKKQVDELVVRKIHYEDLVKVEIILGEKSLRITGLIDSGNSLCDPLTQTPVMILDVNSNQDFIPQWLVDKSKLNNNFTFSKEEQDLPLFNRIRLVPYQVVGKTNQMIISIKPDYLKINHMNNEIIVRKVLIGLSHTNLSIENEFNSLLHPKLLQNTSMFSA